jgi:transcriptional regulator with XRE-family HTH domain
MTSEVMEGPRQVRYREAMHSTTTTTTTTTATPPPIGTLLRDWRLRRRLSQLDLAGEAEVSTRHLSYLETGRAEPSREMVLRLADRLDVPLRERNRWLAAAGFAPMFAERRFDDPALAAGRAAVELVLKAHEPWPALAVDRHWAMVAHNAVVPMLIDGCAAELLQPPVNVLRLSLHPEGLAPRIANLREWRAHCSPASTGRSTASGDTALEALHEELSRYPQPDGRPGRAAGGGSDSGRAAGVRQPARPALVHQHDDGVRHAERRAALGAGARDLSPGRTRDAGGAARVRLRISRRTRASGPFAVPPRATKLAASGTTRVLPLQRAPLRQETGQARTHGHAAAEAHGRIARVGEGRGDRAAAGRNAAASAPRTRAATSPARGRESG